MSYLDRLMKIIFIPQTLAERCVISLWVRQLTQCKETRTKV